MKLIRRQESWQPMRELEALSQRMNELFGMTFSAGEGRRELLASTDWSPSCDIRETTEGYTIHTELPGVKKDDVRVTLDHGILTIQGERREQREQRDAKVHRRELSYGSFMRQFSMPEDADDSKVDARFEDGILTLKIDRSKTRSPKAKQIAVH